MDRTKIMENTMKYYKQNNNVFAYELDGSQDHLIGDKTPMTDEEVELHTNPIPTEAQILESKQQEAQSYLDSTDWIKSKYVELVVIKNTMTKEEFNIKHEVELAKMDEARSIL